MSEEQLNALVAYVKSLNQVRNQSPNRERQAIRRIVPSDAKPQEPKVQ